MKHSILFILALLSLSSANAFAVEAQAFCDSMDLPSGSENCRSTNGSTISVTDCGATPFDRSDDDTNAIQYAICRARGSATPEEQTVGGLTVYMPAGDYDVSQIRLFSGTKLKGAGTGGVDQGTPGNSQNSIPNVFQHTRLHANSNRVDSMISIDSSAEALVNIDVRDFVMFGRDLAIDGLSIRSTNSEGEGNHNSHHNFENISIRSFARKSITIEDGRTDANNGNDASPNQLLTFKNIQVRAEPGSLRLLDILGQAGQIRFVHSEFSLFFRGAVQRDEDGDIIDAGFLSITESDNHDSQLVHIHTQEGAGPSARNIVFEQCTFQNGPYALRLGPGSDNIIINNSWFENLRYAILADGVDGAVVTNNHFANSCGFGCVRGTAENPSSTLTFQNNNIAGRAIFNATGLNRSLIDNPDDTSPRQTPPAGELQLSDLIRTLNLDNVYAPVNFVSGRLILQPTPVQ